MKQKFTLFAVFLFISLKSLISQDIAGSQDHQVIGRYPGSEIKYYYQKDYAELDFPQGNDDSKPSNLLKGKGKHTSILYAAPKNITPLEIIRNYESAIKKGKGKILFSCKGKYAPEGCDDYNTYYALKFFDSNYYQKRYNNTDQYILMNGSDDQAFLLAVFEDATSKIYVEIGIDGDAFGEQAGIQVEVLEESKMKDGLITAALFEEELNKHGKIALYGILFETGKATLKEESKHELSIVFDYLKQHPNVNVYIVGHTDDTGPISLNRTLSRDRAKSVVEYLVAQGLSAGRFLAEGVGPFAPISSNETEEGKKMNRRVEIVKQIK